MNIVCKQSNTRATEISVCPTTFQCVLEKPKHDASLQRWPGNARGEEEDLFFFPRSFKVDK